MNPTRILTRAAIATLFLAMGACSASDNDSKFSVDAHARDSATADDVGLPAYPGATLLKDDDDSSSGANVGLSTPLFGLKVVAVKMQTPDKPEQVAAFYRKALSKYGTVIECRPDSAEPDSAGGDDELHCERNDADHDSIVYKVGSKDNFRIAATKPRGSGSEFSLVHVDVRGESK